MCVFWNLVTQLELCHARAKCMVSLLHICTLVLMYSFKRKKSPAKKSLNHQKTSCSSITAILTKIHEGHPIWQKEPCHPLEKLSNLTWTRLDTSRAHPTQVVHKSTYNILIESLPSRRRKLTRLQPWLAQVVENSAPSSHFPQDKITYRKVYRRVIERTLLLPSTFCR